ncbi:hypothetical protein QJQ45_026898 [Haematococcus lacustris]|nr:hypothetical protein QJQ45_026898 [Haematococcus lacustris]
MAINEWATIAYSDGSCIKPSGAYPARVGAGVYIPENNVLVTVAMDDPESNTINKAELTAIHAALTAGVKRIATDSLCSIYQIRRALANPMSLITHRHSDILTVIATLIIDSPDTIHFYKVRAHSGVLGNEGADALAKHAALHPELANTPAYSPTTRKEPNTWLNNEADGETPAPLPDCRHSVRAHMHRKHGLGLANQDSIYYKMSQEITKAAAKGAGERVMTDTNISTPAQRTALLYRTGGLYNQKLAMHWKRATDDRCPLCGDADSATHLLSGCSETLPMVQERHNGAGRLIAKAISKGTLGGYISFADTGSWDKGAKEDLDLPNDTLHTALRALGLKTATTKNTTRPDILMVMPTMKTGKRVKAIKRVIIIEIKYCSDSRWTDQLDKALNQHTNLAHTIRKEGHMVEIRPILLGIGWYDLIRLKMRLIVPSPPQREPSAITSLQSFGKKGCAPCLEAKRLRQAAYVLELGEAFASWTSHKGTVMRRYAADLWLTLSLRSDRRFEDLMYPYGPKGSRVTCNEMMADGSRCGGDGTINRIFSRIKSYRPDDYQVCNVLCHKHNVLYGTTDPRFPHTVSQKWQKSVAAWMSRLDVQQEVAA